MKKIPFVFLLIICSCLELQSVIKTGGKAVNDSPFIPVNEVTSVSYPGEHVSIKLSYNSSGVERAVKCSITDIENATIGSPCSCTDGECAVGIIAEEGEENASFKYRVANDKGETSPAGEVIIPLYRPFISLWDTTLTNGSSSLDNQIKLPLSGNDYSIRVMWGDGTTDDILSSSDAVALHTYSAPGQYRVKIYGQFPRIKFSNGDSIKLVEIQQWGSVSWDTFKEAFSGCTNLELTAPDTPDLRRVKDMDYMFYNTKKLTGQIGNWAWDTASVESMNYTFSQTTTFNGDISSWDVKSVKSMNSMFSNALAFNQNIDNWDISSVVDISGMFASTLVFNQSLNSWNTSNITSMNYVFSSAKAFNQDLNN